MEFALPTKAVHLRENGIEFLSSREVPVWTEITLDLQPPKSSHRVQCSGIVVGCHGNRHTGYVVSIVFLTVSPGAKARLNDMVRVQQLA